MPKNRYQKSVDSIDNQGGGPSYLNFGSETVDWFNPDLGDDKKKGKRSKFVIIPYTIASDNHPYVRKGDPDFEIGGLDYLLDIWFHRGLGPNNDQSFPCPKKNLNQPCPVCDALSEAYDNDDKEEISKLKPSRRVFYNVYYDGKLKVFSTSFHLFEKELMQSIQDDREDRDFPDFSGMYDEAELRKVSFIAYQHEQGGMKWTAFRSFRVNIEESDVDTKEINFRKLKKEALQLDEFVEWKSLEQIEAILYGQNIPDVEYDEDETEGDAEDVPKEESKKKKKSSACPYGHEFGTNYGETDDCKSCEKDHPEKEDSCYDAS